VLTVSEKEYMLTKPESKSQISLKDIDRNKKNININKRNRHMDKKNKSKNDNTEKNTK
jgi:hypothetical protein